MATSVIRASGIVRAAAYMAKMAEASVGGSPGGQNELRPYQSRDGKSARDHNIQDCEGGSQTQIGRRSRSRCHYRMLHIEGS
jgi:hypothetical protein